MERGKTQNLNCKSHSDSIHSLQGCSSQSHHGSLQAVRTWQFSPDSSSPGVHGVSEEWGIIRLHWGHLDVFPQDWNTSYSTQGTHPTAGTGRYREQDTASWAPQAHSMSTGEAWKGDHGAQLNTQKLQSSQQLGLPWHRLPQGLIHEMFGHLQSQQFKHQNYSQLSDSLQPRGIFNARGRMNCFTSILSNIKFQALPKEKGYF